MVICGLVPKKGEKFMKSKEYLEKIANLIGELYECVWTTDFYDTYYYEEFEKVLLNVSGIDVAALHKELEESESKCQQLEEKIMHLQNELEQKQQTIQRMNSKLYQVMKDNMKMIEHIKELHGKEN